MQSCTRLGEIEVRAPDRFDAWTHPLDVRVGVHCASSWACDDAGAAHRARIIMVRFAWIMRCGIKMDF